MFTAELQGLTGHLVREREKNRSFRNHGGQLLTMNVVARSELIERLLERS